MLMSAAIVIGATMHGGSSSPAFQDGVL